METVKKRALNPLLEELRDNVPGPPDIKELIKSLETTPKIHAGFLYYTQEGCMLLQKLCILLSGTKPTSHYAGWQEFGVKLGLDPFLIKNLNHNFQREDPASYILLAYVQTDNATIENILHTLYEINRHDIVLELHDLVKKVCEAALLKYNTVAPQDILRPTATPNCPFIFKNLKKTTIETLEAKSVTETFQKQAQKLRNRYTKTILLTYSRDADYVIKDLVMKLRKHSLGILILNEQRQQLDSAPEQFIFECFAQVDYVFPVITPEYIKQVMNSRKDDVTLSAVDNPDHKYVKYIYRLINTHYVRNRCQNTRVRCLIPDDIENNVLKRSIMDHSLFQIWVRISEVHTLINEILGLTI